MYCRKGVLRNFATFTGKHLWQSLVFNKVAGLRPATLLKKRLWHRCFPVNFVKFLTTPFLQNTSGRLLLLRFLSIVGVFYTVYRSLWLRRSKVSAEQKRLIFTYFHQSSSDKIMKERSNKFNCSKKVSFLFFVYFFNVKGKNRTKDMLTAFYKIPLLKTFLLLLLLPSKFFWVIYCYIKKNIFLLKKPCSILLSSFIFRPSIFFEIMQHTRPYILSRSWQDIWHFL